MSERCTIYDETDDRKCSKCHKTKTVQNFRITGHIFRTCNACRFRARQLRRERSPTGSIHVSFHSSSASDPTPNELNSLVDSINDYYSASASSSSSASASASASYFVPEPEPEPEPNFLNKSRG